MEDLTKKIEGSIRFAGESIADLHGMSNEGFTAFASAKVVSQIPQNGATYPTNGFASAPHYGALTPCVAMETIAQQQLNEDAVTVLFSVQNRTNQRDISLMPAVTVAQFENQSVGSILAQIATYGGKSLGLSQIASLRINAPDSRPVTRFDEIVRTNPVLVLGATHCDHSGLFLLIEEGGKAVRWVSQTEEITNPCTVFFFEDAGTTDNEGS